MFFILCTLVMACSEPRIVQDISVNTHQEAELIAEHIISTKAGLQIVLAEIFKYPNLHSGIKSNQQEIDFRNDCPCITPDPTQPISSYPITYTLDFGGNGCMPDGITEVKGKVDVTLDGLLCVSEGTVAKIDYANNFTIDGVDMDGCIELTFIKENADGNLCFDSDLAGLTVTGSNGSDIVLKSTSEGKLTLVDALGNNDPNDFTTFLDDYTCQTYSSMDVCIEDEDFTLSTDSELKTNPLCACPVGGSLSGMDSNGNPIIIDFSPNSSCSGTVIINGVTQTLDACL